MPMTMRRMPDRRTASVQGGVRPQKQQGSSVTYIVAPSAEKPMRRSASASA